MTDTPAAKPGKTLVAVDDLLDFAAALLEKEA